MESEFVGKIRRPQTLGSFLALALIRGSFAVLIYYGIASYKIPSLLFLLRTPGTIILFAISLLYLASKDEETKLEIVNNLKSSKAYKRAALLGFFQLCGPYMLFMYAMKFLSPTLGAVFMAATPWATALLEKFLAVTIRTEKGKDWNAIGSFVGVIGMLAVSVANLCLVTMDSSCQAKYGYINVTQNISSNTSEGYINTVSMQRVLLHNDTCLTSVEITTAFLAFCGATLLWSISAVFSRLKRISLHFLVGGLLNNTFGGLYAGILWLIVEQHINIHNVVWKSSGGSLSIIFLSFASSWAASLMLYYLYRNIGAESTNRVMCLVPFITWLEDLLFLHHHRHMSTWIVILEAIGIFLVVVGLYLSSFRQEETSLQGAHAQLLPDYVSEDDDTIIQREGNELTDTIQSEEELLGSGTSSMQDSVEPPMIHYADDDNDDEVGEVW